MSVSFPTETYSGEVVPLEKHMLELGNSDRIRLKFGNYGIEVLESGLKIRVSNLYSVKNGVKTNRTFAVASYPAVIDPAFSREHDAIVNGQSIGIVFKDNGWFIDKRHRYFGTVDTYSHGLDAESLFGDIGNIQPVIHFYSLFVSKGDSEFEYASIPEVHHPEYLNLEDLRLIYGDDFTSCLIMDKHIEGFLEIVQSRMLSA